MTVGYFKNLLFICQSPTWTSSLRANLFLIGRFSRFKWSISLWTGFWQGDFNEESRSEHFSGSLSESWMSFSISTIRDQNNDTDVIFINPKNDLNSLNPLLYGLIYAFVTYLFFKWFRWVIFEFSMPRFNVFELSTYEWVISRISFFYDLPTDFFTIIFRLLSVLYFRLKICNRFFFSIFGSRFSWLCNRLKKNGKKIPQPKKRFSVTFSVIAFPWLSLYIN